MGNIITIKDNVTQDPLYPITKIEAIVDDEGNCFKESLENKILEISLLLEEAVSKANTAANSIITLGKLTNTELTIEELKKITEQVESSKIDILNLTNKYNELFKQLQNTITNENVVSEVIGEAGKIPNSVAVRNYVIDQIEGVLDNLIDTTTIEPNYIPKDGGKILINTKTNEVFISPGTNKWLKLKAEILELPEPFLNSEVNSEDNNMVELIGNVKVENQNLLDIPNHGKVEDDTLIL